MQLRDQLAGEQLLWDAQTACVRAKLGQEAFGGVVARILREIGNEIFKRFECSIISIMKYTTTRCIMIFYSILKQTG